MNVRVSTGDSSPERGSPEPQHEWSAKRAAALESRAPRAATRRAALTLLEMMVSITLLAAIMIGLLAMFNQAQKALHIAHMQSDVFENARGAIQIISRDLMEMTTYGENNVTNFHIRTIPSPIPSGGTLPLLAAGTNLPVHFSDAFWLTRVNDDWQGVGYYVADNPVLNTNYGVGTLFRFSGTVRRAFAPDLLGQFLQSQPTNTHRVSDGIVHLKFTAVYPETNGFSTNFVSDINYSFTSNDLPAFVDVEMGVLEAATLKQFEALQPANALAAQNFLRDHAGRIHFFRERVPIRNFVNPHRANEVQ